MLKKHTLSRMKRLDRLTSRLRVDEPLILREIAEEFGVSLSTINRDIALLREKGIPVETDRGRGGGVRVSSTWDVGRVAFSYREAVDLLVSMASIDKMQLSMIFGNHRSIRTKLIASFSRHDQNRIKMLSSRIRVGPTSSAQVISTYRPDKLKPMAAIKESFLLMRQAKITYESGDGLLTKRLVEPHYLILNHPVWYLLCWDHLRNEVRTFRCDRLTDVYVHKNNFLLRPFSEFERSMEGNAVTNL